MYSVVNYPFPSPNEPKFSLILKDVSVNVKNIEIDMSGPTF